MTAQRSFQRKMIYLAAMIPLLMALFWLSQPATPDVRGKTGSRGGVLTRARAEYGLSQAQLGEIDPTSETIKFATLGMRGIAANILWEKANDYKMRKDWAKLSATVQQIAKLQPNFISVWRFQAWNLSYNVSYEFDDYRDRYHWVINGIKFLIDEGIRYNAREPILVWDAGWYIGQKIGRSDEHLQFRRLFKEDTDFFQSLPYWAQDPSRDNWLVAKRWFRRVEELVDQGATMRSTPVVYLSDPAMCQIHYAEALEEEGVFGEVAKRAWERAAEEWHEFGNRPIPTGSETIRLNDLDAEGGGKNYEALARQKSEELRQLAPEVVELIRRQKEALLSDAQREALATPTESRTAEQIQLATEAEALLDITNQEIAKRVTGPKRKKALELANEADEADRMADTIRRQRDIANFAYWRLRAKMEQTPEALAAHEAIHKGKVASELDLMAACDAYEEGLRRWRQVIDRFPALLDDGPTVSDLMDIVNDYRRVLQQADRPFDRESFILKDVIERYQKP
jgi:hypothetical protein